GRHDQSGGGRPRGRPKSGGERENWRADFEAAESEDNDGSKKRKGIVGGAGWREYTMVGKSVLIRRTRGPVILSVNSLNAASHFPCDLKISSTTSRIAP